MRSEFGRGAFCSPCQGPVEKYKNLALRGYVWVEARSRIPFKSTRAVQPGIRGNYSLSHQVSLAPDGITSQGRFTKRRLAS